MNDGSKILNFRIRWYVHVHFRLIPTHSQMQAPEHSDAVEIDDSPLTEEAMNLLAEEADAMISQSEIVASR